MRIIVVSDTHGRASRFEEVVRLHDEADAFIHLGDGEWDFERVSDMHPDKKMYFVCGNCDYRSLRQSVCLETFGGMRVLFTHGSNEGVKSGLNRLIAKAKSVNADIVLYGHTHIPYTDYIDSKLYIMNPGSLGAPRESIRGTYGVIDIIGGAVSMNIASL